jgi:hypothetical protein
MVAESGMLAGVFCSGVLNREVWYIYTVDGWHDLSLVESTVIA